MGLKPPLGFGPFSKSASSTAIFNIFMGFVLMNRHWDNPAPPERVIPNSHIPNIRPQVDLNLFMSIFKT